MLVRQAKSRRARVVLLHGSEERINVVAGGLEEGENTAREILGDTSCHFQDLLRSAGTIRVERGLGEVIHIDLVDFVACVQGHNRTCCAYHLQLAGLNA